jgi:hypothetical protein
MWCYSPVGIFAGDAVERRGAAVIVVVGFFFNGRICELLGFPAILSVDNVKCNPKLYVP